MQKYVHIGVHAISLGGCGVLYCAGLKPWQSNSGKLALAGGFATVTLIHYSFGNANWGKLESKCLKITIGSAKYIGLYATVLFAAKLGAFILRQLGKIILDKPERIRVPVFISSVPSGLIIGFVGGNVFWQVLRILHQ